MTNSSLTDTQLVLLSIGSQRESGSLVPFSKSLKANEPDLNDAISSLLAHGFASEIEVSRANLSWRETDEARFGLAITPAGLKAIGVGSDDVPSAADHPEQIDVGLAAPVRAPVARSGTKSAQLVAMLGRPDGATIDEIVAATGWLPHTTRAALTGLRKRGHDISNEKIDGLRRYRILTAAA